jgi:penicillin amidase
LYLLKTVQKRFTLAVIVPRARKKHDTFFLAQSMLYLALQSKSDHYTQPGKANYSCSWLETKRRPKMKKRVLIVLGSLLLILVIAVGGWFYWMTRHAWPQTDGTLQVSGLQAPVEVVRDRWGVPHIYAENADDLFFAQGYVHAQDRFYQLEFSRRIGQGRLSEMLGDTALDQDKFIRTVGWWRTAQQEETRLAGESKAALEAYAAGVNAYIESHRDALALEFAILRLIGTKVEIEPWRPSHSLVWGKVMAWSLSGNMDLEILRARIVAALDEEALTGLTPPYPKNHPIIVPSGVSWQQLRLDEVATFSDQAPSLGRGAGIGSNNWVIAGSKTTTGMPLLANDMHLGIQMPSIWYEVGLHCQTTTGDRDRCPFNVTGFSFPGTPGVIVGHNDRIGWGVTNLGPDVQDLYIEQVNPANVNQYKVNGEWVDFEIIREEIAVAGQDEPEVIDVRISRHGPVLNEVLEDPPVSSTAQEVLALKWTALEPGAIFHAVLLLDRAQDWEEFRQALTFWDVPSQNFVYADVDGNIGYQAPGKIPIRKSGDGQMPVPGWTDDYEWVGYIPFEELPSLYNPPQGFIVTANNAVVDASYPYLISLDWDRGYRAQRITEMIEALEKLSVDDITRIHGDNKSLSAAEIIPYLTALTPDDPKINQALERLAKWDMQEHKDSTAAAVYEVIWAHLLAALLDELPEDLRFKGGSAPMVLVRDLLTRPESHWWDDKSTAIVETPDDILLRALQEGYTWLEQHHGGDIDNWTWGQLHTATFENPSLGQSGIGLIEAVFNRGPVPTSGGSDIINATGWSTEEPAIVTSVPSERMILDLADWQRSLTMHTTGQSGHPFHSHYGDMIIPWRDIQYHTMHWERSALERDAEGTLRLEP